MIPKVIHYCWFGRKKKPKLVRDCISSWKKFLPDYEIIEWNDKNSDLNNPFVEYFYKQKKWAFVSDYIRLKVLYEFGGIYLDTDMLVIKKFDDLLNEKTFLGTENNQYISAGIIGTIKNNLFIKNCLYEYDKIELSDAIFDITIPKIITNVFKNHYVITDFREIVRVDDVTIFPREYFYPFPETEKTNQNLAISYIVKETYAIHLWHGSWLEYSEFHYFRVGHFCKGIKKIISSKENKFSLAYYRKLVSCIIQFVKTK